MTTQTTVIQDFYTTADLAKRYRAEESTIRYWKMTGYGPRGERVGRRVLYPRAEVERWEREKFGEAEAAG